VKLMRDGAPLKPFSTTTLLPHQIARAFDDQAATPPDTDARYYLG
jgi:hypothetical protein